MSSFLSGTTSQPTGVGDDGDLAQNWPEIMGSDNWNGLLDPFNPLLRTELIKYGELAHATGDAFIYDIYATKYGECKYDITDFFNPADPLMPQVGYNVTKYLYVSSLERLWLFSPKPKNPDWKEIDVWIGFVAVSDDETTKKLGRRDVCVSWRGTVTGTEWTEDITFLPEKVTSAGIPSPDPNVRVHGGFLGLYTLGGDKHPSARSDALAEIKKLINEVYPNEVVSITVTGHSLGAALALLHTYDIVESKAHVRTDGNEVHVCAMTLAGPRIGNLEFKARVDALNLKVLRVVNVYDAVPKVPPPGIIMRYTHVGVALELNSDISPYLKPILEAGLAAAHNLEGYMHILDGYHGPKKKFESATNRDIALVNKFSGFLKDENHVPEEWVVDLNKGMVKKDGYWVHT